MAWTWGTNTIGAGQTQRWWLWWNGYPGFEVIGVQPVSAGSEIRYTAPGMETNGDGSTTYFITISNVGASDVQYHFTGTAADWTYGTNTLNPGESQRWWLWWPEYPGLEVIGVQAVTAGVEIDYSDPGFQTNADGSATYYITVTNVGGTVAQYHFVGFAIC